MLRLALPGTAVAALIASATVAVRGQPLDPSFFDFGLPGLAVEPGVTVRSREHPEYDYLGSRLGSFMVRPEASVSAGYDSNVRGTPEGSGSALVLTRANVSAANDLSQYSVSARLGLEDHRYLDLPKQSYLDWGVSLGGTYRFARDTLSLTYEHAVLHQTPVDLDTPELDAPIAYRVDRLRAAYRAQFGPASLEPELNVTRYDYDNGTVAGLPYPQRQQSRVVVAPGLIGRYELAERRNLVVVVRDQIGRYTDQPTGAVNRDFNDISLLAGIDYDSGGRLRYQLLAGYEVRTFSSAALKTIQAPVLDGTVIFNPTGMTTITGRVIRRIQTSSATNVDYTATTASLEVDHEYMRNLILSAYLRFSANEYNQHLGEQYLYRAGASATWMVNRNMRLTASYDFADRRSNAGAARQGFTFGPNYSSNRYLVQLNFGL